MKTHLPSQSRNADNPYGIIKMAFCIFTEHVSVFKILIILITAVIPSQIMAQASASANYSVQTGSLGTGYSWIDCSGGTSIVTGDDKKAAVSWPFNFSFYNNSYTTANSLSVATNGFIRLDGIAAANNYSASASYNLTSTATEFGQIICMAMYDCYVGRVGSSWVKYLVTGTAPYRVLTIEYNDLSIPYYAYVYANVQVSFYETSNKIVLKLGDDNITTSGVDMGIHSGVEGYYNKWQEVYSGTNNTWIEYSLPVKVTASSGTYEAYYSTLKDAFDKINSGVHQGVITVYIQENTIESSAATLNASGNGSANYTSVNIYPTKTGLSVAGNLDSPLIDLNGADNVTIDGRVNATGSTADLQIINSGTSPVAGISTIRFINDATNNTIKYCTIKGSETVADGGIIYFSTTTASTGNDGNTISNNNITSESDAYRPVNAIFSLGTSGKNNNGNIIQNNNIYDFLNHSTASNGIFLSSFNTAWTISGNSFYETTTFISTNALTYNAIKIYNISGDSFNISGNYIGGSSPQCGGTAWTKSNAANDAFNAIYFLAGTGNVSSIQNNTIQNFSWNNPANASWTGINIAGGNVNIGTTSGNTIGSSSGTGSITVTGATNGQNIYGINISGSGTVDCQNNLIGSITSGNLSTLSSNIFGINKTATAGTTTISNNIIGSTSTSNSINAGSTSTSNPQTVNGICSSGTGTTIIYGNTIANLNNSATALSTSPTFGIITSSGSNSIRNNTIYNISTSSRQPGTAASASAIGIVQKSNTAGTSQSVNSNTIYNISNSTPTSRVDVYGLYYAGPSSGTNTITGNFIHSLSVSSTNTACDIEGIVLYDGLTTSSDNIISLGTGITTGYKINGILDNSGSTNSNNIYFNTVYIGGSVTGTTSSTSALWNAGNTSAADYRNNILMNARSGGTTGSHYSVYLSGTTSLTIDYNDYYVSGTGGVLAYLGSDQTSLASLQTATGQDANSVSTDPVFTNAGGLQVSDYYPSATLTGVDGSGVTTDFYDITRSTPPKMGALESNNYIWHGSTSTDFATSSNWANGSVPPNGADIVFAADPDNSCVLDQNRTIKSITNAQSTDQLVLNGHQLTITGNLNLSNGAQIDAGSVSSAVIFAGTSAQSIPDGAIVSNTINSLTLNNSSGLTINGDIILTTALTLSNGSLNIGANTLTINGSITTTSGSLSGGSSSNITIGGSGAGTYLPAVTLNNLTLNRSNGISLSGNASIYGALTLTAGTLTIGANELTINGSSIISTSGDIDAGNAGATIIFNNSSAITFPYSLFTGNINNMTISGAGGITSPDDLTINGTLNLPAANPASDKGILDMSDGSTIKTLNMGATSSTLGLGDVTGIIRRTTIIAGVMYTFGNEHTSAYFTNDGTLPTEISAKITIGSTPSWRSGAINREIEIIQTGGSSTKAMFTCHYLDSELNGNDETRLCFWTKYNDLEYGRSGQNTVENWVSLSNVNVAFFPSSFDDIKNLTLDEFSNVTTITWNGSVSDSWTSVENWTPNSGPSAEKNIIIPDASVTPNSPTIPLLTEIKSLTIEANGVINSVENAQLTINGGNGAWINNGGTFNPNTSNVTFTDASPTISGTNDFYDVTINSGTTLMLLNESTMRIAGAVTNNGVWRTVIGGNSTVEYNGGDQTVIIPNTSTNRYYNLILSGTGVKTLPATAMNIAGNFSVTDGATTTAAADLTIDGDLHIGTGSSFATGNFDHSTGGNFDNNGTFTASAGHSITFNGTGTQSIMGSSQSNFENLIINNSSGVSLHQNVVINNSLTLTSGNLNVGSATLTINGDIVQTAGYINVDSLSSLIFGGTTSLNATNLFATSPVLNNLTVNRTGGLIFDDDLSVLGTLYLQSSNPSSTLGSLDMGNSILTMGEGATNSGIGDVTGKIKRTNFSPNIEYTFGNPYTSVTFPNVGTLPTEITVEISIGTAPSWKTDGIQRIIDISQTGGSETRAIIKSHYLESELNGNSENSISFFSYVFPTTTLLDRGLSELNTTENWITLNNANFTNLPSAFGVIEHTFGVSTSDVITWDGSESSDWFDQYNWTPDFVPDLTKKVIIPDAGTTPNDPTITSSSSSTILTLSIQNGGILNAGTNSTLTVVGTGGVWSNYGTFNASTGKVIFSHGVVSEIATISGETNFYDIEVGANTTFQPVAGSILRIAGTGSSDATSLVDFSSISSTVEWNGSGQTIENPVGIGGSSGYYNLIISGSGVKTMPDTEMNINGDFSTSGTITATAAESIIVAGDVNIGSGTSFETGNYSHFVGGNFSNDGTFTAASGTTVSLNGTSVQTVSGSSTTNFDILEIDNTTGVSISSQINVDNELILTHGNLTVGNTTLGINGTITQTAGYLDVTSVSSLNFGGTSAITLNNYLFSDTPTINNLTINRSGGVTLGNQGIIINGTLNLTSGTLTLAQNSLTIAGNSPVRTGGYIDAGNASATLLFSNTSAITLPASVFSGNVNNLTINGTGGVTAGSNITVNGILNLQSANPSSVKGCLDMNTDTLDMGVNSSTTGTGDVSGVIRRQHTFSDDIEYSFGNRFTTIKFLGVSGSVKPGWISCKTELGASPDWRSEAVMRIYSFAQDGAGTDRVYTKLHYLDSELNGAETDESLLTFWDDYDGLATGDNTYVTGKSNNDSTNNWIELLGMATNFIAPSTTFEKQYSLAYSNVTTITWTGLGSSSYPGDWSLPSHWSGGVPTADDDVLIPASLPGGSCGYPDQDLLIAYKDAVAKTIEIESGATLDASGFNITIYGDTSAWVNNGTFIPGDKTVFFSNGDITKTIEISGTTQFNNLAVTDKTNLVPATGCDISVRGNLLCDGNYLSTNSNTVTFNSSTANQTISGTGQISLYNMTMNNTFSGGKLSLSAPVSVSNTLTLTNNNIVTDAVNYITIESTATVSPESGSAGSYVEGPVVKDGNTAFTFPIGSASVWAPVGIEAPASSSIISATYNSGGGPYNWSGAYMCAESGLSHTSGVEHWLLTTTDATPGVTLYWKSAASDIVNPAEIVVSHYNGTCWDNMGGTVSGDVSSGYVSSTVPFSSYSPVTFGTKTNENTLPVSLLYFDVTCDGKTAELNWATASETNNRQFEIEKSHGDDKWSNIGTVTGSGNSNSIIKYDFKDINQEYVQTYYRLKQTDYDGKQKVLAIGMAGCFSSANTYINIMPNPAENVISIVSGYELNNEPFLIRNAMGQTIITGLANGTETLVNVENLKPGVYYVTVGKNPECIKLIKL